MALVDLGNVKGADGIVTNAWVSSYVIINANDYAEVALPSGTEFGSGTAVYVACQQAARYTWAAESINKVVRIFNNESYNIACKVVFLY